MKKIAQDLSELLNPKAKPAISPVPTSPKATIPKTVKKDVAVKSIENIKKMQEAIIDLAKVFTSQRANIQKEEKVPSTIADYLTENYLSDKPGTSSVALSFEQISDPKISNLVPDGKWGEKTNNALRNVYNFANSLLSLADDFSLKPMSYNRQFLDQLGVGVHYKDDLPLLKKIEYAPIITKHINSIKDLYMELRNIIYKNPTYRSVIEGQKVEPEKKQVLPSKVLEALNNRYKFEVSYTTQAGVAKVPILVKDISNSDNLKAWQQANVPQMPLNDIITQVKNQIANLK